ncbi:uracil-DNA glycosylase [bacterium]|nr:uracil-DNA glycosylase [bacterium]
MIPTLRELWEFFEAEIYPVHGGDGLFNPYCDFDARFEIEGGPQMRRENLRSYFENFDSAPRILILGEAYGPWGGRFSGIPFTGEAPLSQGELPFRGVTTSRSAKPYRERTGDVFWGELALHAREFFVWNTLPFHPFHKDDPLSIRSPSRAEISASLYWLQIIIEILGPEKCLAIGRVAETALKEIGVNVTYIRHPSRGGIGKFREGMRSAFIDDL